MFDTKKINDLARKLCEIIPDGVKDIPKDCEEQFRHVLSDGLQRMNVVSREEFDVQVKVLQRTREKCDELEAQVAKLIEK